MHLDVVDLRNFYYRTRLGRAAQAAVRGRVQKIWPEAKGLTVAGFGFAAPLLRPYLADARRVMALMPGPQGVMGWPMGQENVSALVEETSWPVETGHIDRLIVLHGLETSEQPRALLDECWRVLGPGGRALFIVPNRAGLWSRRDGTPFGYGRPYSIGQLEQQLKTHAFVPESHSAALFQYPSEKRFWLKLGPAMERFGASTPSTLVGGVLMVEVSKRVNAPTPTGFTEAVRRPLKVLDGMTKPDPKPAMRTLRIAPLRADCDQTGDK